MSKVSKFYSDSYFFGIAQLIERLISFFMLPVLANSVSKVEYAIWTQSIVTAGILMPIVLMGFQTAIVKYLPRWSENLELSNSILTAIILAIFTWMCFICIFFIIRCWVLSINFWQCDLSRFHSNFVNVGN